MERGTLSCVIFDMDGTLTRTNDLIFASFNHVAQKYLGKTFSPGDLVKLFGPPEEGALEVILDRNDVPNAMDDLCAYYRDHHAATATLHRGMEEILMYLTSKGCRRAVFTGKGRRTTDITVEGLGLSRYFDLVVTGNDVVNHKPHPEGILKILRHFSLRPDQALMVGDSHGDLAASRAAGVRIATVLWDSLDHERTLSAGADYVFHRPAELLDWLTSQFS